MTVARARLLTAVAALVDRDSAGHADAIAWRTIRRSDAIVLRLAGGNAKRRRQIRDGLERSFGTPAVRTGVVRPAELLVRALRRHKATVSIAESCTGGLIGAMITELPGVSAVFWGGAVAYSNEAKSALASVPAGTVADSGAVSAQTARAMASGIRATAGSSLGIAVTGIAGPGGGSPEKPVGLVWIAAVSADHEFVEVCNFSGARRSVRHKAAVVAVLAGEQTLQSSAWPGIGSWVDSARRW